MVIYDPKREENFTSEGGTTLTLQGWGGIRDERRNIFGDNIVRFLDAVCAGEGRIGQVECITRGDVDKVGNGEGHSNGFLDVVESLSYTVGISTMCRKIIEHWDRYRS